MDRDEREHYPIASGAFNGILAGTEGDGHRIQLEAGESD
jgi:hypothetical protein